MNPKQVIIQQKEQLEALNCEYCSQKKAERSFSDNRLLLLALLAERDTRIQMFKAMRAC
jgi:hypothetical protein